ncbi:hypothetical protein MMC28_000667 [Mycoblastus sanguinarius]|nr:hypothetical protein [Mycoblastus sanguinarius]
MAVTVIDSEPSIVALLDCLENLPTQPPSLYLDIEGVRLSRHGSISIVQLFVLPTNHVFLIDIFGLQDRAFCTPNHSGTDLRSILESALMPKVFFDVRNDADALFAHFQISLRGAHDVQLLEVATRSYPKNRLAGLAKCIESDVQLPAEAKEAWIVTKERGLSLFASERGGSPEIFNSRPMLRDIIDYCIQDVVHLPVLWKTYSQKISTKWLVRVQEETDKRIRMSQAALYDPHGKNKTLTPWANETKNGKKNRSGILGARATDKKQNKSAAEIAAMKAAQQKAAIKPDAKVLRQSPVGDTDLKRSMKIPDLGKAQGTRDVNAAFERPLSAINLPLRHKPAIDANAPIKPDSTANPAAFCSTWTCTTCRRQMQETQKQGHLAGKQHIARLKQASNAGSAASCHNSTVEENPLRAAAIAVISPHKGKGKPEARLRKIGVPGKVDGTGTKSKKKLFTGSASQQAGLPYHYDWGFSGFRGGRLSESFDFFGGGENYGLCDKDCGWCGHCMDGADL